MVETESLGTESLRGLEAGHLLTTAAARFPQGPGAEDESREPCQEDGIRLTKQKKTTPRGPAVTQVRAGRSCGSAGGAAEAGPPSRLILDAAERCRGRK